MELTNTK